MITQGLFNKKDLFIGKSIDNLCDFLNDTDHDYPNAICVFDGECNSELEKYAKDLILMYTEETATYFTFHNIAELIIGFSVYKFSSNHRYKYINIIVHKKDIISKHLIGSIKDFKTIEPLMKNVLLVYIKEYIDIFLTKIYNLVSHANCDEIINKTREFLYMVTHDIIDREIKIHSALLHI